METTVYWMFGVSAILIAIALIAYLTKYPTGVSGTIAATWTADKVKKVGIPIGMFLGLNFLIWLITSGFEIKKDLFTLYTGLNTGLMMFIGLYFLPIKGLARLGTVILMLVGIILITSISFQPTKIEKTAEKEIQSLAPLELTGWRGSAIIEAPIKGNKPSEWSRMVIKKENQETSFQPLETGGEYITKNGNNQIYRPYEEMPLPRSLAERTFRFQATGKEPVKVLITWETKWLKSSSPKRIAPQLVRVRGDFYLPNLHS